MQLLKITSNTFSYGDNAAIPDAYVDPDDLARVKRLVTFGYEQIPVQKERTSKARKLAKERKFGK